MTEHRDRILDWREELRRLEPELSNLPAAAQRAVRSVVEQFMREDELADREPLGLFDDAARTVDSAGARRIRGRSRPRGTLEAIV